MRLKAKFLKCSLQQQNESFRAVVPNIEARWVMKHHFGVPWIFSRNLVIFQILFVPKIITDANIFISP